MSRGWRCAAQALLLVLLSAAAFAERTWSQGQAELAASRAALEAGELERSIRHARHAASAYVPGAGHVQVAAEQLRALAREAERGGERELAASAWQALRAAVLEHPPFSRQGQAQLGLASANLARLRGFASPAAAGLEQPTASAVSRSLLGLGFLGALAGLSWLCVCAWSADGSWQLARALWPVLGWCSGALLLAWALLHG